MHAGYSDPSTFLSHRYGNILDFSRPTGNEDAPLNLNKTASYQEPSRTASAKQHYLRQSRYLPGNKQCIFIHSRSKGWALFKKKKIYNVGSQLIGLPSSVILKCCPFKSLIFMIAFLFISGISTKKNVAINASKDFTGSHLWGSSSIPFGGTLPSRGAHGNFTVTFRLFVVVVVKEVQSNGLLLLTIRHKYSPRWIHAIFLQKRQRLCRSQRASGSFSGDNSIK